MIVVIDYRAGNLHSVGRALKHLKVDFCFSRDPETVAAAKGIILPGVGSARAAMESLQHRGLIAILRETSAPFLGICLGLQLLFESSEEENTPCLGVFEGCVRRFDDARVKVPHIGWNQVSHHNGNQGAAAPLLRGIPENSFFYFVHSYYAPLTPFTLGLTDYGVGFSSAVAQSNFWGVQFHPELSGDNGLRLLQNFVSWAGRRLRPQETSGECL